MKQLRIASQTDSPPDLLWVDEIAALLPENLRVGWYRNVKPWITTLSPEDEVAHLAYAMGYLGLLIRECPSLVAAERTKAHDCRSTNLKRNHRRSKLHNGVPPEIR